MRVKRIRGVYVEVGKEPRVIEFEDTLEEKQRLVGGYIQMVCPRLHDDTAVVICNEEGKLLCLEPNRELFDEFGRIYAVLRGNFFIIDAPIDSDEFGSLSDEQIDKYIKMYGRLI